MRTAQLAVEYKIWKDTAMMKAFKEIQQKCKI